MLCYVTCTSNPIGVPGNSSTRSKRALADNTGILAPLVGTSCTRMNALCTCQSI